MICTGRGRGYRPGNGLCFLITVIMVAAYFLLGLPQRLYALVDPPVGMLAAWVPVMASSFIITKFISLPLYKKFEEAVGDNTARKVDIAVMIFSCVAMAVLFYTAVQKGNPFTTKYLY